MEGNSTMNHMLNPCRKRIPRRQIAAKREGLEKLLLEGLNSGASEAMTSARKRRIYRQALADSLQTAER
jgi:hypothetical protein